MASFPGKSDMRSAPYFRVYQALSADVNLTTEVEQARCACSGMMVTNDDLAAVANLVIADCAGTEVTFVIAPGTTVDIPVGATRIDETTDDDLSILVYWHGSNAR